MFFKNIFRMQFLKAQGFLHLPFPTAILSQYFPLYSNNHKPILLLLKCVPKATEYPSHTQLFTKSHMEKPPERDSEMKEAAACSGI